MQRDILFEMIHSVRMSFPLQFFNFLLILLRLWAGIIEIMTLLF